MIDKVELAAARTRALFCGLFQGVKRLAVYVAFSDETEVNKDAEFFYAGYVASENNWPWLARAWQERVLDGNPTIPYLHMTDIRSNAWRDEHRISYHEAERRVDEAVRVLYSTGGMSALASGLNQPELRASIHSKFKKKSQVPKGLDVPDYACFMEYVGYVLAEVHNNYPDAEKVDFVVSRKATVMAGYNNIIDWLRERLPTTIPEIAPLLGALIPGDMEEQLPLQAADVLCWHLRRYHSGVFDRIEESRIWMLTKEGPGHLSMWEKHQFDNMAKEL